MNDEDIIVEFDWTANEVYDCIMKRIEWADMMMNKTDDEGWYLRKLAYEEVLDDFCYDVIKDPKLPYFKNPELTKKDIELAERIRKQEKYEYKE